MVGQRPCARHEPARPRRQVVPAPGAGLAGAPDEGPSRGGASKRILAALDIGSTSVHLLVARVTGGELVPLLDRSTLLGLGGVVDRHGRIPATDRRGLLSTLVELDDAARLLGAGRSLLLATEPFRRARDAREVGALVEARLGQPIEVLSHEEEAQLSLLGLTGGHRPAGELLIVDIGGGSTEFVLAGPDRPTRAGVVATGAARLTDAVAVADPPAAAELLAMKAAAGAAIEAADLPSAPRVIAIGGTAANLARVATRSTGATLDRRLLRSTRRRLLAGPADSIAAAYGLHRLRARLLPAGGLILEAILERVGASTVEISEASLRDGAILALAAAGDEWRARLPELTWTRPPVASES